jgi:signal transduction histidine kinase
VFLTRVREEVIVSVTNRGTAIPVSERERIFEMYYRGNVQVPGHGIGLYLCKLFVEQHGGSIWTDGDADVVRFNFSLPIA